MGHITNKTHGLRMHHSDCEYFKMALSTFSLSSWIFPMQTDTRLYMLDEFCFSANAANYNKIDSLHFFFKSENSQTPENSITIVLNENTILIGIFLFMFCLCDKFSYPIYVNDNTPKTECDNVMVNGQLVSQNNTISTD